MSSRAPRGAPSVHRRRRRSRRSCSRPINNFLANLHCVGYSSVMHARSARRWLAIASVATLAACHRDATAPQRPVAPVAPVASSTTSSSPAPQPVAPPLAADPPPSATAPAAPPATAALEPPVVEPPASPPCAKDPQRDATQKPDHVMQLAGLGDAMTVVDLGSGSGYFLCWLSRAVGP